MADTYKLTGSDPINRRPSAAQRRAAEIASLADQQAQLKQEAADRRARLASKNIPATPPEAPASAPNSDSR